MKNRRLAIVLCIFAFLVSVIVLSSAMFSLSDVSINFMSTTSVLTGSEQVILDSADFQSGKNVLFINKGLYVSKIEALFPYIKVVNIETKFPNRLVVNCVERNEVFVIKLPDNTYAVCDEEFKVLRKAVSFINTPENAILLTGLESLPSNITAGKFLNLDSGQKAILQNSFHSFREWNLSYVNLKAKIVSLHIDYERKNQIQVVMQSGVQIVVKDANQYNSEKFNLAFSVYDSSPSYQSQGIIEIRLVSGTIEAFYKSSAD